MGTRLGRYDIIRTLSKGELTDLLLARADGMEGFQRHVAIKRLHETHARDPGCLEAFVNEARLAAALHHHNIVQVLDIGQEGAQPYFAMEFVHGVDLRALLNRLSKRSEQLPLPHVVSIVAAAAAALHHAHEQRGPDGNPLGIVHRDVTPANIVVGFDGNIKVVDFGIAKAAIKRIKTDQGVLKGRVPYMAPEQCAGKPVDRRSDVFALGIVTYELATVRRLFKGATEFLTMSAIVNGDIPRPSQYRRDVPAELEQIMMKALARDPMDRYQSAGEMAIALDEVALQVGVGASTTQLANYMKLQFGEPKEPWLVEPGTEADPETTAVDFDGGASGLAPPPAESVKNNAIPKTIAATRSSPIAQVRNIVTPPKGSGEDEKKSVPIDKSYSMSTEVEAPSYDLQSRRESTDSEHVPTEKLGRTNVASPPPPPPPSGVMPIPTHAGSPTPTDATEIVVPLPVMPLERPVVRRSEPSMLGGLGRSSKSRVLIVAAAFAIVVIVAGAIVLWPGSDVPASAAPDRTAQEQVPQEKPEAPEQQKPEAPEQQKPEAPEQQKPEAPEQQKADTPSGLNATMADYDKAREEQAAADKAAADKAAADADKQAAADKAAADKQAAADAAAAKKQAAADEAAAKKQAAADAAAAKKQAAADAAAAKKQAAADKVAAEAADKADKQAKTAATKRASTKPAATKTVKRPTPKPAAKKSTKKGAKWNPDELFLGD